MLIFVFSSYVCCAWLSGVYLFDNYMVLSSLLINTDELLMNIYDISHWYMSCLS